MTSLKSPCPSTIVVRMPNWIGDFVMATPILADLKTAFPDARLTVMCRSPLADLLNGNSYIDELLPFNKLCFSRAHSETKALLETLRHRKYDLGVLLTNSFSSAWGFWRGNVKRRVGFKKDLRSFFLTDPVALPKNIASQHLVLTYKQLLAPLRIPLSTTPPQLFLAEQTMSDARLLLKQQGIDLSLPLIGINPGAAYGTAKCWPPERFREVTEKLLKETKASILYFGDPSGSSLVEAICSGLPKRVINLAGKTSLCTLSALIKCCTVLLTNDSGPMHIASAVGTPLVALFGSTNEKATGPYLHGKVIHKHAPCSPCYQRICPIDFRCMKQIEVEEVLKAVLESLHSNPLKLTYA